ncbi:MAG: TspO/MBR family protein [Sphingobacteriaceae bacterium]
MMKGKKILALVLCISIPVALGAITGIGTASGVDTWFKTLNKPSFNPPNSVFAPVWTVLYMLMGISLYLVWQSPEGKARRKALNIFVIQLLLNFSWSFIFFYFRQTGWALTEIVVLWCCIIAMIMLFYRVSKKAAVLQIPYLLWVSFAMALNAAIWRLN